MILHVISLTLILTGKETESLIPCLLPGLWYLLGQPQFGVIWNSVHFSVNPWPGHIIGLYLDHYIVYPDLLPGPFSTTKLDLYQLPPLCVASLLDFEPNLRNLLLFLPHTNRHTCVCVYKAQHPPPQHIPITHNTHNPWHLPIHTHNTHTPTKHTTNSIHSQYTPTIHTHPQHILTTHNSQHIHSTHPHTTCPCAL